MIPSSFFFLFLVGVETQINSVEATETKTVFSRDTGGAERGRTTKPRTQKVVLTGDNWNEMVGRASKTGRMSFVKFYAPWCGHCSDMASDWEMLGDHMVSKPVSGVDLVVGEVNCMDSQSRAKCSEVGVNSYPAIKLFRDGVFQEDFFFARTFPRMKRFLHEVLVDISLLVPNSLGVFSLDDSTFAKMTEDRENVLVVLFYVPRGSDIRQLRPAWEELAITFLMEEAEELKFAEVNCMDTESEEICTEEGVTTYPTIYLYKDGVVEDIFGGDNDLRELENFVWRNVEPNRVEEDDGMADMLNLMAGMMGGMGEEDDEDEDYEYEDEGEDDDEYEECDCEDPDCDCDEEMDEDYEDQEFEDEDGNDDTETVGDEGTEEEEEWEESEEEGEWEESEGEGEWEESEEDFNLHERDEL